MRHLSQKRIEAVETEVKMLLHASRDCMRNKGVDTTNTTFKVDDGYYGEAFGVMRGLAVLGYGYFGSSNLTDPEYMFCNLKWWFAELEAKVLQEENFGGSNECNHCVTKYGKDGAGRTRESLNV